MHIGRGVLGESFLESRRSGEHDVNLEVTDSPGQLSRRARDAFLHIPAERKDDMQINSKASEKADSRNQTLTST